MASITDILRQILSARYGKDVRQAIHDGIQQCYYDGKAGSIDLEARQDIQTIGEDVEALKENTTSINKAVADLQAVVDITTTTSTTQPNSFKGREHILEIGGVMEQGENPSPDNPQEIKKSVVSGVMTHNEQLFDASRITTTSNGGFNVSNNKDGSFTISGNTDGSNNFAVNYEIPHNDFVKLFKAGKIYAKAETNTFPYFYINTVIDGVNNPLLDLRQSNFAEAEITQEQLDNKTSRLIVGFYGWAGGALKGGTIKPMVYQDGDGTWKPYQRKSITLSQPIELYGMGDVQDVIDVERGKIVRNCGVKVFDGSSDERWNSGENACWTPMLDRKLGSLALSVCSRFRYVGNFENAITFREFSSEYGYFGYGIVDTKMIYIKYQHENLNEFISFLTSNPITVVYELETPTETDLPTADQIALNSLQTYDGITYVEIDSEIKPTFKAEYGTSKVGGYTLEGLLAGRNGELLA